MRIYDRDADGVFIVRSGDEVWEVDPNDYLSRRQTGKMIVRSDMVHQFANHLEDVWREAGHADVEVYARIMKSLNGRPMQPFIDPGIDLTDVPLAYARSDAWVLPNEIGVWGIADTTGTSPTPDPVVRP